ncbi:MAG: hypothetical protein ACI8PZ_002284 [Myxococcota bacterium]|jgi:hypothetical protein
MWTRRQLLLASAAGTLVGLPARAAARPRRMILVLVNGGWDSTMVLDPKFGVPGIDGPWVDEDPDDPLDREYERTFAGIPIVCNDVKRPTVTRFWERYGGRASLVNGVWTGTIAHDPARYRVLTGRNTVHQADVTTVVGRALGGALPLGSIDLCGLSYTGPFAASTGQAGYQSQVRNLVLPEGAFRPPAGADYTYPLYVPGPDDLARVRTHLDGRSSALAARFSDGGRNDDRMAARTESLERASRFRTAGADAVSALELGERPDMSRQVEVAVELLAQDLCATVLIEAVANWDTHRANVGQHANFEVLFAGLEQLADALDARGMWDDTLVCVTSEMTRTPKINAALGKDHWPQTSWLFFGGQTRGGSRFGGTTDLLEAAPIDWGVGQPDPGGEQLRYDHVAAGVLAAMDVDPAPFFPDAEPFLHWRA